ncbi:MAG: DUF983 domain-containing protein [Ktedonobacteraceae bacterium]|nr:DUF983 domain-containing protein [Ktedonobacteraceae bacterium]
MNTFTTLLTRGLLLRCPVCGRGKLFSGLFTMNKQCPYCHFRFEREEGYFTSSMAINLVVSELLVTAFALPLAANPSIPILPVLLVGAPLALLLPLLFFPHSRGLWLAMDHYMHPLNRGELSADTIEALQHQKEESRLDVL